jgi:hypothetical protein
MRRIGDRVGLWDGVVAEVGWFLMVVKPNLGF